MDFFKKKVLVLGLGKTGISVLRWLSKEKAHLAISDSKSEKALNRAFITEASALGAALETGGHRRETFEAVDLIVVSPGVPLDLEPLDAARRKGIPVMGELELASRLMDVPIVAVTGTNGKSTTTAFIGEILKRAEKSVFVGGNIGTPLIDYVTGDWNAQFAVIEVSSFQLDTLERFCPKVALLLNVSPDHLDRYADYEAYVQSKLKIFQNQGPGHFAVLNDGDERISKCKPAGGVSVLRYGLEKKENRDAYMNGEKMIAGLPGEKTAEFTIGNIKLPGIHNLENLMAGVLAGLSLKIRPEVIQETLIGFKGLAHRLEFVGSAKGVDFYNDSKATNVDAAKRSIESFDRPVILIAGGRHKGGDYLPLVKASVGKVRHAILMGESKPLLRSAFDGVIPFTLASTMEEAVSHAYAMARSEEVVLLASACSSFDMYSDYGERGDSFKKAVKRHINGS